jgi:hypothetical protein
MACTVLLAIGCGAALFWKWRTADSPPPNPIPAAAEIASIRFRDWDAIAQQEVSLEIPPENWQPILKALQPMTVDPRPSKWMVIGTMDIVTKTGEPLCLSLGDMPRGAGAFATYSRRTGRVVYYRGGDSRELKAALQAARGETLQ